MLKLEEITLDNLEPLGFMEVPESIISLCVFGVLALIGLVSFKVPRIAALFIGTSILILGTGMYFGYQKASGSAQVIEDNITDVSEAMNISKTDIRTLIQHTQHYTEGHKPITIPSLEDDSIILAEPGYTDNKIDSFTFTALDMTEEEYAETNDWHLSLEALDAYITHCLAEDYVQCEMVMEKYGTPKSKEDSVDFIK